MPPVVSVVVTCFNLGEYLPEALASVNRQSYRDIELIVVDDGSTDSRTKEVMAHIDSPARVIHLENRGLPGARNAGVRDATGDYICALDADDCLESAWIETAVRFLEANPHLSFASHWVRLFGEETGEWKPERCDLAALLERNTVNGAALVRAAALRSVGGYDETMTAGCEDWDLWLTLVEQGFPGSIIQEFHHRYRRRPDSMSRTMMRGDTHLRIVERLIHKHRESFAAHLEPLLLRQETELARMRADVEDRWIEDDQWLLAEADRSRRRLQWWQDKARRVPADVARLRTVESERDTALEEGRRLVALVRSLKDDLERTATDRDALIETTAAQEASIHRAAADYEVLQLDTERHLSQAATKLDAVAAHLEGEVSALRNSVSWRLTGPLRAAWRLLAVKKDPNG